MRIIKFLINISSLNFVTGDERMIFILSTLLLFTSVKGNSQTYEEYHREISTAEEFYFLKNNVDSSLHYYQYGFESFDFIFAKDAVNALQIAYREGRSIDYFLKRAMQSGVTPSILENIPALSNFVKDSLPQLSVMRDYDLHRSHYLDRINVECLNKIYKLGIKDQIDKNKKGKRQNYNENTLDLLFDLALKYGLPGEKNCGIEDSKINKELGKGAEDFLHLRDSISAIYGVNIRYFKLYPNSLGMHLPIVIMLHNYCTYKDHQKALHEAYLEGFIHPREIGNIYDNAFRGYGSECLIVPNRGIFILNGALQTRGKNIEKANRLRTEWNICSIETDQKKKELQELGYIFIWDYW